MIAYHYPPCRGSSGLQRTLSFSRYLPRFGWQPIVLSARPTAYPVVGEDQLSDIPSSAIVKRAFALDTARHLSFRGRYFGLSALPDRWVSWLAGAVPVGLSVIHRYKPNVLWSTHPIPTAHLIGVILQRLTGLPWVADFRDPMTEVDPVTQRHFPADSAMWQTRRWVERHTIRNCSRAVFVAPGTLRMYRERYLDVPDTRWASISNGYDEENFTAARQNIQHRLPANTCIRLLHSGLLYAADRDPSAFFAALARLRDAGIISSTDLKVILRAPGDAHYYLRLINDKNVGDIVSVKPAVPYREALAEMLAADGLLLFQWQESNANIPAKLYEYLRAQRPILAFVDPAGDTASVLKSAGRGKIVPANSEERICNELVAFLRDLRAGTEPTLNDAEVKSYSRLEKTYELAKLFNSVITTMNQKQGSS